MKVKGIAATMQYMRVYRLHTYKLHLTKDGRYVWKKMRNDDEDKDPTWLLQLSHDEFYALEKAPYLKLDHSEYISVNKKMRTTATKFVHGAIIATPVITQMKDMLVAVYHDNAGKKVLRGSIHNRELSKEEQDRLSAHEKTAAIQERKKTDALAKERKSALQKARRAALKAAKDNAST